VIGKATEFIQQVKGELAKVTWPSRKDTYGSTLVVIALVLVSAVYLGAVDLVLARLARFILS
jgi:preprotein translocase subunit SecE